MSIIELVHIDESSHEELIVFLWQKRLKYKQTKIVTEYDDGNVFGYSVHKNYI